VAIPDVTGLSQVDATQRLANAGFRVAATSEASTDVPAGQVIRTQPGTGTQAAKDSTVTLVISSGPRQVTIPDVVGQSEASATSNLEGAGLKVSVVTVTSPGSAGRVISQTPGGGSRANAGSTVTITVGAAATTTSTSTTSSTSTPP
jgi:serine/threonine-protein kinase